MSVPLGRRAFLKQVSAGMALPFAVEPRAAPPPPPSATGPWKDLPRLDGTLLFDDAVRGRMAIDLGRNFRRLPAAVLQPRSVADVVKIVRFARVRGLSVAMRGQGHSQYGQTLAEGGIVIDSSTLRSVRLAGPTVVEAAAGASWDDVTRVTLARSLTPPVMGDTMTLSVGGILSAGGIGNSSYQFGAVVDNVEELDVVTGAGDLVTCSGRLNRELYELALGGMGQCALITRARLRLVPAPESVVRRELVYDDLAVWLGDQRWLVAEGRADHLGAYIMPPDPGVGRRFRISVGRFGASPQELDLAPLETGLRFASREELVRQTYPDYLHREAARNAAAATALTARLPLTMFLPGSRAEELIESILARPAETANVWRFSLYLLPTAPLTRPLLMIPREELALCLFLFRSVPAAESARYANEVDTVRRLCDRLRAAGGTAYPPYAPFFSRSDWQAQYGATWQRLAAGKKKYDPATILTPGMGISAVPALLPS